MSLKVNLAVAFEQCLAWHYAFMKCGFLQSEIMTGRSVEPNGATARVQARHGGQTFLIDVSMIPRVPQSTFDREWAKVAVKATRKEIDVKALYERWFENNLSGNSLTKLLSRLSDKGFPIGAMKDRKEWQALNLEPEPKETKREDQATGDTAGAGGGSGAVGADPGH